MLAVEIIERIKKGQDSYTHFKREMGDPDKLAEEFVAFSNARGGMILVGVDNDGRIRGVDTVALDKLNQLIANVANENVKPPVYPLTEVVNVDGKMVVVINLKKGESRPYQTGKGVYFTKSGSDKHRISSEELRRLFAESHRLYADEEVLPETNLGDLNSELFYAFLEKDSPLVFEELKAGQIFLERSLENRQLLKNGHLTLAGNLIFGKTPQRFTPSFYVDCVYFRGYDTAVSYFVSKATLKGTLGQIFDSCLNFVKSNLLARQTQKDINLAGAAEIDETVLTELIVNALVHRDYYMQASIKVFIFFDRVEIISPGKLPNALTVEKIKSGISIYRNPTISSLCKNILPYSGYGSGIKRVLRIDPTVEFINDVDKEQFICVIKRQDVQGQGV